MGRETQASEDEGRRFMKPTAIDGHTAVSFDHTSAEHAVDPAGSFKALRERCPVGHSAAHGGFWVATTYETVSGAARDATTFSSALFENSSITIPHPSGVDRSPMPPLELDPPEFEADRRLVAPLMSPQVVGGFEEPVQYYSDWLLDQVIERGEMEFISEFANPVPSLMTVDWLGLPIEDWRGFAEPMNHIQHEVAGTPAYDAALLGLASINALLLEAIRARRAHPAPDVIGQIATATIDGELITEERALGLTMLLIAGGVNTTTVLSGNTMLYLDGHRDTHQRLLDDDRFFHTATEELLRHITPVLQIGRTVTREVELGGQTLAAGDPILLGWAGANRDPAMFEHPDEVILERWPNRHLSFGIGPHRCIGSNLARVMFRRMIRTLLARIPDFEVIEAVPAPSRPVDNSWSAIRVRFTPGPRVLDSEPLRSQFYAEAHR